MSSTSAVEQLSGLQVPFFRVELGNDEIEEVVSTLRSGWLTTGPRVRELEEQFAAAVGARYAVGVNSCTAALHLAVEALQLRAGDAVLVPTMTFAATAEVVRYCGATPVLVDCDPVTLNMDLGHAEQQLQSMKGSELRVVGIMPVHVGGMMLNVAEVAAFASRHSLWVVEDAAHALPAAWRPNEGQPWQRCGDATADVTCFSFYANKTMTTGEGGMAVTNDAALCQRMRSMSLHGLSNDAWGRYSSQGKWDYRIIAPGFKYNLTDIAAAIGLHQLKRVEPMRVERERIAGEYFEHFRDLDEIELPPQDGNRIHSWHLYPIQLRLERLAIDRNTFIDELKRCGVGCSVHWRPLHLHPYYEQTFQLRAEQFPSATSTWQRLVSLPLFPAMTGAEVRHVISTVQSLCRHHSR